MGYQTAFFLHLLCTPGGTYFTIRRMPRNTTSNIIVCLIIFRLPRNVSCAPGLTCHINQPFLPPLYVPPGVHVSSSAVCHVILRHILPVPPGGTCFIHQPFLPPLYAPPGVHVSSSDVCHVILRHILPVPPGLHVTSTSLFFHPCVHPRG